MSKKKASIEFSAAFKNAFNRTYGAIAGDVEQDCEGQRMSEKMRREIMVESVLDANRMIHMGGPDGPVADKENSALIAQHGWVAVRKAAEKLL